MNEGKFENPKEKAKGTGKIQTEHVMPDGRILSREEFIKETVTPEFIRKHTQNLKRESGDNRATSLKEFRRLKKQ